jgi:hypothetical protein
VSKGFRISIKKWYDFTNTYKSRWLNTNFHRLTLIMWIKLRYRLSKKQVLQGGSNMTGTICV